MNDKPRPLYKLNKCLKLKILENNILFIVEMLQLHKFSSLTQKTPDIIYTSLDSAFETEKYVL